MIAYSIDPDEQGLTLSLKASGHSGQAAIGQDIVCSAVSILVLTLAEAVKSRAASGMLTDFCAETESGRAEITCTAVSHTAYGELKTVYDTVALGLGLLSVGYPDFVCNLREGAQITQFGKA